jgi:hypothetical protein
MAGFQGARANGWCLGTGNQGMAEIWGEWWIVEAEILGGDEVWFAA